MNNFAAEAFKQFNLFSEVELPDYDNLAALGEHVYNVNFNSDYSPPFVNPRRRQAEDISEGEAEDIADAAADLEEISESAIEGASSAFLILSIVNWITVFGKWFCYWYGVVEVSSLITSLNNSISGLSFDDPKIIDAFTDLATDVLATFETKGALIPGGCLISSLL